MEYKGMIIKQSRNGNVIVTNKRGAVIIVSNKGYLNDKQIKELVDNQVHFPEDDIE